MENTGKRMPKAIVLSMAICTGSALACSVIPFDIRFDTLQAGTVMTTRSWSPGAGISIVDTVAVSGYPEFKINLLSAVNDSALVFLGRFDSLRTGPGFFPPPDIDMAPHISDTGMSEFHTVHMRLRIDSLLRGTFSPRTIWIRLESGFGTCTVPVGWYLHKPFLNFSNGFSTREHLRLNLSLAPSKLPDAHWFDGRYLVSPDFPGLRLDITELYPDYPATGILRRTMPTVPWRPDGKLYRPDGRAVPEKTGSSGGIPALLPK